LRLRTKLAAVAVSGATTVAFFGVGALTNSAHACGSAQGAPNWSAGPVYASSPPQNTTGAGYIGVAGSGGGFSGYAQAAGAVGPGAGGTGGVISGNVVLSGSGGGQSGTVGIGNDSNGSGAAATVPSEAGQPAVYVCG